MLTLERIEAGYGAGPVLRDVSLEVRPGEVFCLVGRNGAGKTTTLKAVIGLVDVSAGRIRLDGEDLVGLAPHEAPGRGIGYVPQGRRLFEDLTVGENIEVGLMAGNGGSDVRARVLDLFPALTGRLNQRAGTLSGGEQQMLAIARALCLEPRVVVMDEPTEGLQPSMVAMVRRVVDGLRAKGAAVLLVEQRLEAIETLADRVGFMVNGFTRETVSAAELARRPGLLGRYVGVGA